MLKTNKDCAIIFLKGLIIMIIAINFEKLEKTLGNFFGKIGKFFVDAFNVVVGAFDKFFPHEVSIIILITLAAFIAIYIFTQKINK